MTIGILGTLLISSIFSSFGDTKTQIFQFTRDWTEIIAVDGQNVSKLEINKLTSNTANHIIESIILPLNYPILGVANASIFLYGVNLEDLNYLKIKENLKLISGKWFQDKSNQIVVPAAFMKARNLKIGDYIGGDININDRDSPGVYCISGVIYGDHWFLLGAKEHLRNHSDTKAFLIFSSNSLEINNLVINKMNKNRLNIRTPESSRLVLMQNNQDYYLIFLGISMLFAIIVGVGLGNLNVIYYSGRLLELSIKNIMGYSKKELFIQVMWEQSILGVLGWLLSTVLGYFILKAINLSFFASQGLRLDLKIEILLGTLIIPLVSLLFIGIYIRSKLKKTDLFEIILGKR